MQKKGALILNTGGNKQADRHGPPRAAHDERSNDARARGIVLVRSISVLDQSLDASSG